MKLPDYLRAEIDLLARYREPGIDWDDPLTYDWLIEDAMSVIKAALAARMEAMLKLGILKEKP